MTSHFPPFALLLSFAKYSIFSHNKNNITRWLEDINFMFSWQEQYLPLEHKIFSPPGNILYILAADVVYLRQNVGFLKNCYASNSLVTIGMERIVACFCCVLNSSISVITLARGSFQVLKNMFGVILLLLHVFKPFVTGDHSLYSAPSLPTPWKVQ